MVKALAFDLGASSGRAVVGQFDAGKLTIIDTHRFPNEPVHVLQHMHWDILRLLHEIKQGLIQTRLQGHADIESMGIDTWGVDFGLLNAQGELLGNPYHYRDGHTSNIMEQVFQQIPQAEVFQRTGIQFISFNTIYQLAALQSSASLLLGQAETLLLIPELLRYFLTGKRLSEWTIASTTQLCNPITRNWDMDLLQKLDIPTRLFQSPVSPGTLAGTLLPAIGSEVGLPSLQVVAVAEHDTASAVVAVPATSSDFAYLSSGTWSLLGTEITSPILSEQALQANVTNEGGINQTIRLLKNVTGLWLLQECRRIWKNEGLRFTFADEEKLTVDAPAFRSFINPDHSMFMSPAHMPHQIQMYCQQTGQPVPQTEGEIIRCILGSLALRYRYVLELIENLVQKRFSGLHVVGGGSQNTLLCQYTANALGRTVWAGPVEATAIGNLLVQYIALGHLVNLQQARSLVQQSFPIHSYKPLEVAQWESAYTRFCQVM
ncbi:rhamnulokinase [Dictyobacter aurantiacus]|uniref:L-fuculose kinase n=1 Tax=Dictyobacter aurantiacus TaxID=1936993 RepID=A0A401Z788_9CHLR|nr:rhamnulokinase family protein [Dictyobacter aurantiacus]GCE02713.1 L-fuculose kinase [Dictyobacter aurantiacus]